MVDPIGSNPKPNSPPPPPPPPLSLSLPPPTAPAVSSATTHQSPSSCSGGRGGGGAIGRFFTVRRPAVRVTSEFDSDSTLFFHKVSCKILDGLAKLKLSFQNDIDGKVAFPQLAFLTKHFAVHYDVESQNALLKGSLNIATFFHIRATHDVKEQQGEVAMTTCLGDPSYKLELSSLVPSIGLPRATFFFPHGEVSVEEKKDEETEKVLSISGIMKGHLLNGVCTALYKDNDLNLRYCYKDEEMTIIPSISLPSNALTIAFKRQFSLSDKLSYWYHFDSNEWSAVYKHTVGKDLKVKAGYDSEVKLGWASLWVGDEEGKAKTAPMKMKVQLMVQVQQDDIRNPVFLFRVKKRWDF